MKRLLLLLASVTVTLAVAASGSNRAQSATAPCGTKAVTVYTHVVVIVMENHGYDAIIGRPAAPYINSLAKQCGLATDYFAITHPSLPNYLAMTAGTTAGVTDDKLPSAHPLSNLSIFSQEGSSWRSYEESMPSNCYLKNSSDGLYVAHHNPAAYYTNIRTACQSQDVPLPSTPSFSSAYTTVEPNMCHTMSSCSVTAGDGWLKAFVPKVLASPEYKNGNLVLFLTWDEGGGRTGSNRVPLIVVGPTVPAGLPVSTNLTHYGLLLTVEQLLGKTCLANACSATSLLSAFHL
jgi:phospholipase C